MSYLPQVGDYAKVPRRAMERAFELLTDENGLFCFTQTAEQLEYCERTQPGFAAWLRVGLKSIASADAAALTVFLAVWIWKAFVLFAGERLGTITEEQCRVVVQMYRSDEQMRADKGWIVQDTQELVQLYQPQVVVMLQEELEDISELYDGINALHIEGMYKLLLLQILILSYAVMPDERHGRDGIN